MFNKAAEKITSNLVLVGAPVTSLFIVLSSVTDPVNATKLVMAGAFGFASLALFLGFNLRDNLRSYRAYLTLSALLLIAAVSATLNSESPLVQNIYGSYGRNTGLVTYISLVFASLATLTFRIIGSYKRVIIGLQITGLVNVLYCAWVLAFGDFLSWNNPYGNILGLFGNPNFIGSFLGIFISSLMATIFTPNLNWKYRVSLSLVAALAFYEVIESNAIQGLVVTAGGIAIVGFFLIRSRISSPLVAYSYLTTVAGVGFLAVMGALQKGPFDFIYKTSVSLRGAYWSAGIEMGKQNPLTGVGMDSYGDWYRADRSESAATVFPGPRTVTNAAHNVVIDFFAFGGWPLLLPYLGLIVLAAVSALKVIKRTKTYDPVFVALFAAWAGYQAQSFISINQIGLAIWGWILTSSLVGYEFATRPNRTELSQPDSVKGKGPRNRQSSTGVFSPQLLAGLGIVVGLIIASPPMSADTRWRSALNSQDANRILAALEPTYLNPGNSEKYAQAVQLFANSNLMEQAHKIALDGVKFNPDYFYAWRALYNLPNATEQEKADALANMKRLDPRNPDVLAN